MASCVGSRVCVGGMHREQHACRQRLDEGERCWICLVSDGPRGPSTSELGGRSEKYIYKTSEHSYPYLRGVLRSLWTRLSMR